MGHVKTKVISGNSLEIVCTRVCRCNLIVCIMRCIASLLYVRYG